MPFLAVLAAAAQARERVSTAQLSEPRETQRGEGRLQRYVEAAVCAWAVGGAEVGEVLARGRSCREGSTRPHSDRSFPAPARHSQAYSSVGAGPPAAPAPRRLTTKSGMRTVPSVDGTMTCVTS